MFPSELTRWNAAPRARGSQVEEAVVSTDFPPRPVPPFRSWKAGQAAPVASLRAL